MVKPKEIFNILKSDDELLYSISEQICQAINDAEISRNKTIKGGNVRKRTRREVIYQQNLFDGTDAIILNKRHCFVKNKGKGANSMCIYKRAHKASYSIRFFKDFIHAYIDGTHANHIKFLLEDDGLMLYVSKGIRNATFLKHKIEYCNKKDFLLVATHMHIQFTNNDHVNSRILLNPISDEDGIIKFKLVRAI